jgi:hypothetical protein
VYLLRISDVSDLNIEYPRATRVSDLGLQPREVRNQSDRLQATAAGRSKSR